MALTLAGLALEKKAIDPVVLYVEPLLGYCSHFLIVGGSNSRQVRAIASHVLAEAKAAGMNPIGSEGRGHGKWILLDFGDVVVHVFDQDQRGFYDLEGLWADAEVVEIPGVEPRHPAQQAWV
jgi:ribosome-associated protein